MYGQIKEHDKVNAIKLLLNKAVFNAVGFVKNQNTFLFAFANI